MARKKGTTTLDTMIKMVMQNYEIATRKDMDRLLNRIDRLEKLVKTTAAISNRSYNTGTGRGRTSGRIGMTASDTVLEVIKSAKSGIDFQGIQAQTGFNEKKLRNIIFRLNKIERIKRKSRGIYVVA